MNKKIADINIGIRHRKDLGDVQQLADSIAAIGLLHPVVLDPKGNLVAGARRLHACREILKWQSIPVTVAADLDSVYKCLLAERDENRCRKEMTPSESAELAKILEPMEQSDAKKRREATAFKNGKNPVSSESYGGGKLPPPSDTPNSQGKSGNKIADAVGMSRTNLDKARDVMDAAEANPEAYGDLPAKMDATGKVDPAHQELHRRQAEGAPKTATRRKASNRPPKTKEAAPKATEPPTDEEGVMLPDGLIAAFADRPLFDEALNLLTKISGILGKLATQEDGVKSPGGAMLRRQEADTHIKNLRAGIKHARPHAVCPYCKGKGCAKTVGCRGLGWCVESQYATTPRDMRAALKAKGAA